MIGNRRNRRPPEEIAILKAETPCHSCQRFSHWCDAHSDDGSLNTGTPSHNSFSEAKAEIFSSI